MKISGCYRAYSQGHNTLAMPDTLFHKGGSFAGVGLCGWMVETNFKISRFSILNLHDFMNFNSIYKLSIRGVEQMYILLACEN